MALPIVETPRYELTLPSKDLKVQFRPFLVKEEKVLLMALETGEELEIQRATSDVLKACTFDKLDIENLPTFDIEYIFLQIRAKSIGEVAKFKVVCPDDKSTYGDVEIDLSKVEVQVDDNHSNNILLDEKRKLGVILKYPTMKTVTAGRDIRDLKYDDIFAMMLNCIDHIYDGEKIYPSSESTVEELKVFFEQLPQTTFTKMKDFFDTMPRLRHEVEVLNPKTQVKSKVVFNGLQDFFGFASPTTA